jgi:hypothetical protein
MHEDRNAELGYSKMSVIDRGGMEWDLVYVARQGRNKCVVKRYEYDSGYTRGLMKVSNLRHRPEQKGILRRLLSL